VSALAWCCGAVLVVALGLAASGLRGRPPEAGAGATTRWSVRAPADLVPRLVWAAAGAVVLGVSTGWPVAALGGLVLGYFGRELLAPRVLRHAGIERTEAIAAWTEQLRDTMAAAAGLQQAIVATAPLSPEPIRAEVVHAATSAERQPLVPVLLALADDLADPTADLVVTALVLAASGQAQDLGEVLSTVASSARDDATMRRYIDASRARTRTAVRTITVVALATVVGLLVLGHGYLRPYSSVAGQLVLAVVLVCYGAGVGILQRMGREKPSERILGPAVGSVRP
jgi:tight adherence protein B